ncbi:MAG: endo-1,4-beta-xylanase [Eubacterium sp.]|nr:endo-1,4-beta-xylanase [Eubacterium sp.]
MKKRILSAALVAAMAVSTIVTVPGVEAAKKPKLSKKKVTLKVGKKKVVKIKNAKKAKISKIKWKSSKKKVVSVKKKSKYSVTLTAKKKGKAVVTCTYKKGKKTKKLKCKVTVKANTKSVADASATPGATADGSAAPATASATADSAAPTQTAADNSAAPAKTDAPAQTSAPVKTDAPVQTTAPVKTDAPAKTDAPVKTDAPAKTSAPVAPTAVATAAPTANAGEVNVPYSANGFVNGVAGFDNSTNGFSGRGPAQVATTNEGHSGNGLAVTGRTDTWNGASLDVSSTFEAGEVYLVSGWIKHSAGAPAEVKLSADVDGASWPVIADVENAASGEWTYLEGTFEVPEFSQLSIYFEIPGSATADFVIDDVKIVKTKAASATTQYSFDSLKEVYSDLFGNIGTCVNYNGWKAGKQLQTKSTLDVIKYGYNSITLEDEMKPSSILGGDWNHSTISVEEAKNLGYYIPDNYTETTVPRLNLDTVDKVLEICYSNGLRMRGHNFMWHQQTPTWFFCTGYNGSNVVSEAVMDARMEFYIKTVMKHVMDKEIALSGKAGSIVYAWDVVNEYLHHKNDPASISWVNVYGEQGVTCSYAKKAFEFAYEELKAYNVTDKVTLFYNDYNTYDEVDDLIAFVNYINEGEEAKICGGIGMQAHLDVQYPSVGKFKTALTSFIATGLEVQITELDVTTTAQNQSKTDEDQAAYVKNLMEMIISVQKKTNGITGLTVWGLYDSISWRANDKPLFFSALKTPKVSYQALIDAVKNPSGDWENN